ncbi:hypothetical protein [Tahibacter soli]|uniref:Uncharacterized protein n=1 Tax=Tahibacter soli TaxID=2983605 RepID=A0A9X3YJX6_9GAMM|nr:hypothetical protein [Tahibacter soli]MDC8012919.1 hypothetical protein [Tahibacter soli]
MKLPTLSQPLVSYALAAAVVAAGFAGGWTARGWREAKADLKAVRADAAAIEKETARRQIIGARYEQEREAVDQFYRALPYWWPRVVADRPDLEHVDIGPVGLCVWNRWNAGPGSVHTCAAGEGTDDVAGGQERGAAGPDGEPRGDR